jgi:hypothetical protein
MNVVQGVWNGGSSAQFAPDPDDSDEVTLNLLMQLGLLLIAEKHDQWIVVVAKTDRWKARVKANSSESIRVTFSPREGYEIDAVRAMLGLSATERETVRPSPAAAGMLVDLKPPHPVHTATKEITTKELKVEVGETGVAPNAVKVYRSYVAFFFSFMREDENFSQEV